MKETISYIAIGLAVLLLVTAGVQAVQIGAHKESMETGTSAAPVAESKGPVAPAPRAAAPTMVGGC